MRKKQEAQEYARMIKADQITNSVFWDGYPTRQEVQNAFNEHAEFMTNLRTSLAQLDVVVSFIVEKLGITHEDVQAFLERKAQELAAAKPEQPAPEPEPKLVVEG
jgi:uncharacterized membrane-anchored protein YhcB (DUF1043 family)